MSILIDQDFIANRYVAILLDTAETIGLDKSELLLPTGLDLDLFDSLTGQTSMMDFCMLVDNLVGFKASAGVDFGLRLNINMFGKLAELLMSCSTLLEAGLYAHRFLPLAELPVAVDVKRSGSRGVWILHPSPYCLSLQRLRFFVEFNFISLLQQIKCLTRNDCCFERLEFSYGRPPYVSLYQRIFNCQLRFNCEYSRAFFSNRVLGSAILSANPVMQALHLTACEQQMGNLKTSGDFSGKVRQILLSNHKIHTLEQVANYLKLPLRSVRTRLEYEKTSFRRLLNSLKCEKSCRMLRDGCTTAEVAAALNYHSVDNFRRAFKSWAGVSPSIYMKKNVEDSGCDNEKASHVPTS